MYLVEVLPRRREGGTWGGVVFTASVMLYPCHMISRGAPALPVVALLLLLTLILLRKLVLPWKLVLPCKLVLPWKLNSLGQLALPPLRRRCPPPGPS